MDYAHLPVLVDLSDKQAGADLNQMSSVVDGVIVKMGEANPGGDPKYDPSFHVHVNNAYYAKPKRLPAGAFYVLNTNQYQGMTLEALKTMQKKDNPNYVFIRDTLQSKAVNFLGLVMQNGMGKNKSASNWLMQDLDTLYRNLHEGMVAKEIPTMPIMICTNKAYIDANLIADNFYTWMAQHQSSAVDIALNSVQAWPQDYSHMTVHQDVWSNVRKYVPTATAKPDDVLNGIPSWLLWQIGSTMFPKDAAGNMMYFSLNMSFINLERLYAWMKYTPVVPPVSTLCDTGYHLDANGVCVKDDVPVTPPVTPPTTDWQTAMAAMETRLTALINHPGWMK